MRARQAAIFVREHRAELLDRGTWQLDDEGAAAHAEQPVTRQLHDRRVELVGDQHLVDRRGLHLAAHLVEHREEARRLERRDLDASGAFQPHEERAHRSRPAPPWERRTRSARWRPSLTTPRIIQTAMSSEQCDDGDDVDVAEGRQQADARAIARLAIARGAFQLLDQLLVFDGHHAERVERRARRG